MKMKERNNSRSARVISKNPIDIVSRDASASMRNKAWGLFCPPLWSVAHYRGRGGWGHKKKAWHYVFIHYSAYIMYTSSAKTRADGVRRRWSVLTMDRFTDPIVFEYALSSQCSFEMRNVRSRLDRVEKKWERERERDKTGKWEEKGNLKSLLHSSENIAMIWKQKRGMRYIRIRSVDCWMSILKTIPRSKISQFCCLVKELNYLSVSL